MPLHRIDMLFIYESFEFAIFFRLLSCDMLGVVWWGVYCHGLCNLVVGFGEDYFQQFIGLALFI
jgi:hypothetical protein